MTRNSHPPVLEIEGLKAGYKDYLVLKGVDIQVNEGEVVCLIGPNGAGKSTVLNCIFGLLQPSEGVIKYRNEDIIGVPQRRLLNKGLSYMLQRDAIFPDMTVLENLEMGAYIMGDDYDIESRIDDTFEMFPILKEKSHQNARVLSGGQRQMLEFARGLMLDPDFLLIDEPTAGLAPKIINQIFDKISQINDTGVTILLVEQNIRTALKYADHSFVLENGQTRFDGPADEILDRPEIRAAYLGEEV